MAQQKTNASASGAHRAGTVLGILLTILLVPVLLFNAAVMVQSVQHQVPPKLFGHYVMIMPDGDLAFFQETDPHYLSEQDTVAFLDRGGVVSAGEVLSLSRVGTEISSIQISGGQGYSVYNVSPAETFGKLRFQVPFAGRLLLFLDTDIGALLAIGLPLIGALIYDIRRRKAEEAYRFAESAKAGEAEADAAPEPEYSERGYIAGKALKEPEPASEVVAEPETEPETPEIEPTPAPVPANASVLNSHKRLTILSFFRIFA